MKTQKIQVASMKMNILFEFITGKIKSEKFYL